MFTSETEKCSEWIFDEGERTIVNDVNEKLLKFTCKNYLLNLVIHFLLFILVVNYLPGESMEISFGTMTWDYDIYSYFNAF